jgi:hypothetical protein
MTVDELAKCIADHPDGIKKCEKDFVKAGGAEGGQEGGKVFSDTNGGKVFVTDGGKVFGGKA